MKYRDIIRTANGNLRKSKLRTFLTVTAVVIGAFTLTMTNGLGDGIRSYVNTQLGNVGAKDSLFITVRDQSQAQKDANNGLVEYNPDRQKITTEARGPQGSSFMTDKDVATIAAVPGVKSVVKTYTVTPSYMTAGHKKFQTTVNQYIDGFNLDLSAGRTVRNNSSNEITIPETYLGPLGLPTDPTQAVGKQLTFGFLDARGQMLTSYTKIVGVQRASLVGSSSINASSNWVHQMYLQQNDSASGPTLYAYLIARFDVNSSSTQLDALKSRLGSRGYDAKTIQDQIGTINQVLGAVTMALNIFGAIALLAASFGIINTLFMAVQERTREIGLMKALGMGRRKIFLLFSLEAILIGLWGSVIGILLANGAGRIINQIASKTFLKDFENFKLLAFPLHSVLLVVGIIVVIAFLAGTLPARRASQKDPIEALRYE
jgi:putative ABC transport system permease protein